MREGIGSARQLWWGRGDELFEAGTVHFPMKMPKLFAAVALAAVAIMVAMLWLPAQASARPRALGQPGEELKATLVPQKAEANPGDQFALAVVIDYAPTWHSWPNFKPELPKGFEDLTVFPTELAVPTKDGKPVATPGVDLHMKWVQWPKPHLAKVAGTQVLAFSDRTIVYVPVTIATDAKPGEVEVALDLSYQACDENVCAMPNSMPLTAKIKIVPVGQATSNQKPEIFGGFTAAVFGQIASGVGPVEKWEFDFIGTKFSLRKDAYFLILLIAFVAGVLMNFTPCVLPVIPLKILSLQSHAKSPGKLLYLGVFYCVGVILLYLVLGLLAFGIISGGQKFDWGQLFSLPWFTVSVAILVAALGVAMTGGVSIRLPNFVYSVNPTGDSALGNLIGGLLTGILATPCTGPLLGASFAWATTQPPLVGLSAITMMGVGMAAPYALLICFPKLLSKMPRGGAGSELLKQVMGIFMIAVAAFLFANIIEGKWPWWVISAIAMAGCLWLIIGAWRMLKSRSSAVAMTIIGIIGIGGFFVMGRSLTDEGPLSWNKFKDKPDSAIIAAITEAKAKGRVVVVDFTAKWCVSCQFIEKTSLNSEKGVELLTAKDVTLVKVDLTNARPEQSLGWGVVKEISGGGGIPLIAIYGPALEKPVYFQSFFEVAALEAAMSQARGK